MLARKLSRAFYTRPTVDVARDLLGKRLILDAGVSRLVARIVETEAYAGPDDLASHAARGRQPQKGRAAIMFGPAGFAYVYLIYGMHWCLNVVTEPAGYPAAVLFRAAQPLEGLSHAANGPGKLCHAFGIDRRHHGTDFSGNVLYVEDDGFPVPPAGIAFGPRVGIGRAGEWASRPWRYWIDGHPDVSR